MPRRKELERTAHKGINLCFQSGLPGLVEELYIDADDLNTVIAAVGITGTVAQMQEATFSLVTRVGKLAACTYGHMDEATRLLGAWASKGGIRTREQLLANTCEAGSEPEDDFDGGEPDPELEGEDGCDETETEDYYDETETEDELDPLWWSVNLVHAANLLAAGQRAARVVALASPPPLAAHPRPPPPPPAPDPTCALSRAAGARQCGGRHPQHPSEDRGGRAFQGEGLLPQPGEPAVLAGL